MSKLQHFLLVFDHEKGRLIEDIREFGSGREAADDALEAYADKEREFRDKSSIEIVLIGSDSLDTVKLTHANYFDGTAKVSKYLAGLLSEIKTAAS